MDAERIKISDLPPLAQVFARAVGIPTTLVLLRAWGGREKFFPAVPEENSPVASVLGLEAARKICGLLDMGVGKGRSVYIPIFHGPASSLKGRILDYPADAPAKAVAQELGCTVRYVRFLRHQTGMVTLDARVQKHPPSAPAVQVARSEGCSPAQVQRVRKKAEVKKRRKVASLSGNRLPDFLRGALEEIRDHPAGREASKAERIRAAEGVREDEVAEMVGSNVEYVREVRRAAGQDYTPLRLTRTPSGSTRGGE